MTRDQAFIAAGALRDLAADMKKLPVAYDDLNIMAGTVDAYEAAARFLEANSTSGKDE